MADALQRLQAMVHLNTTNNDGEIILLGDVGGVVASTPNVSGVVFAGPAVLSPRLSSNGLIQRGHGAYFADDPRKSHKYTKPDPGNQTRVMFYNKVLLGKESIQNKSDNKLVSAPKDYHSVRGTQNEYTEYIIYRYGQALPYLKITYKA